MWGTNNYDFRHAGEVDIGQTLECTSCRMSSEDMKAEDSGKHFGCRTLRASRQGTQVCILIVTGHTDHARPGEDKQI